MKIQDVLSPDVQYVPPETSVCDIAKLMKTHDCGSILVGENDKLTGIITDRDITLRCVAESKDAETMTAAECMSPGVLYCHDTDVVEDVMRNMGEQGVRRMPVVNKDKRLVGIVSLADLAIACEDKGLCGETIKHVREAA